MSLPASTCGFRQARKPDSANDCFLSPGPVSQPLPLGSALIEGLSAADEVLVRPQLRAMMEKEVAGSNSSLSSSYKQ